MKKKLAQKKKWQKPLLTPMFKEELMSTSGAAYPDDTCGNCSGGGYAPGPCWESGNDAGTMCLSTGHNAGGMCGGGYGGT